MAAPVGQSVVAAYTQLIHAKPAVVASYSQILGNGYSGVIAAYSQNDADGGSGPLPTAGGMIVQAIWY